MNTDTQESNTKMSITTDQASDLPQVPEGGVAREGEGIPEGVMQLASLPGDSEYWHSHDGSELYQWRESGDWVILNPFEWGWKTIERSICKVVARVEVPFGEPKLQRPINWERRYWAVRDAADRFLASLKIDTDCPNGSGVLTVWTDYVQQEAVEELRHLLAGNRNTDTRHDWERRALDLAGQLEEVKADRDSLRISLSGMDSERSEALGDAQYQHEQNQSVTAERDALKAELERVKEERAAMDTTIADYQKENAHLQAELERVQCKMDELREESQRTETRRSISSLIDRERDGKE